MTRENGCSLRSALRGVNFRKAKVLGSTASGELDRQISRIAGLACLVRDDIAVRRRCGLQTLWPLLYGER